MSARVGWLGLMSLVVTITLTIPLRARAEAPDHQASFERTVLPILNKYCGDCHAQESSEGRWAFDGYRRFSDLIGDQRIWRKVELLVSLQVMPPADATAPPAGDRRSILRWIDDAVFYVDPLQPNPGRTTLRRLNKAEYNNSVRDAFGLDGRPADHFPADDAGYGFDNIGDVLSLSPLHLEKYLGSAREIAAEATRPGPPPRVGVELRGEKLEVFSGKPETREFASGRGERKEKLLVLKSSTDEVGATVRIPASSSYRVVTQAAVGLDREKHLAKLELLCDGKPLATLEPRTEWKDMPARLPFTSALLELPAGEHKFALRVRPTAEGETGPEGAVSLFSVNGPYAPTPPEASAFLRQAAKRPMATPILRLSGEDLDPGSGRTGLDTGRAFFATNGHRYITLRFTQTGQYRIRFKVGAQQVGKDPVKFEARLGKQIIGPFSVTAGAQGEQWIEATAELPAGEHDWQVWFVNEFTDPQTKAERWLWLHEFTIEGPLADAVGLTRDEGVALLKHTGRRLFRRPLTEEESLKLAKLVDQALAAQETPLGAVQLGLETLLVSPKFLFHPQPRPTGQPERGTVLVDELTLAARLANFLWSSLPDEELLALAESGKLRAQLAAQVKRLIADPKSSALTENFAGQWLQLRDLANVVPDAAAFPEFDARLAADMRRESELFFEHILRENRPIVEFLTADYTFVNPRLAKHYGLPAPAGDAFQKVSLAETPRGGLLTQASILTLTSHPTRTAPVKRGKWLLEHILGIEPPPPPKNVPPLPEPQTADNVSLRDRMEQHRSNKACAACHAVLDPPGFALENYDAIGRWRTSESQQPVDASAQLITGEKFQNWVELRDWLGKERRQEFARCLTEHLLTFALGRGITYHDKLMIREIASRGAGEKRGFQDLILDVIQGVPFQRMQVKTP